MVYYPAEMRDTMIEIPQETHTNEELFHKQVALMRTFLERNAISQAQFDKSYHDLCEKMGFTEEKQK